jgi:hypothetical protein
MKNSYKPFWVVLLTVMFVQVTHAQTSGSFNYTENGDGTVTITSTTSGVAIRYTTDGSIPSETHGTIYSVPVPISTTTTLQAIAYESGFSDSPVTSGSYTISVPIPVMPPWTLAILGLFIFLIAAWFLPPAALGANLGKKPIFSR